MDRRKLGAFGAVLNLTIGGVIGGGDRGYICIIYMFAYVEDRTEQARLTLKELRREPRTRAGAVEKTEASGGGHHTESGVANRPVEVVVFAAAEIEGGWSFCFGRRRFGELWKYLLIEQVHT